MMSTQAERDEFNAMIGITPLPKIDLGVSVEEKQALWPNDERVEKLMVELKKQGHRLAGNNSGRAITFLGTNFNLGNGD